MGSNFKEQASKQPPTKEMLGNALTDQVQVAPQVHREPVNYIQPAPVQPQPAPQMPQQQGGGKGSVEPRPAPQPMPQQQGYMRPGGKGMYEPRPMQGGGLFGGAPQAQSSFQLGREPHMQSGYQQMGQAYNQNQIHAMPYNGNMMHQAMPNPNENQLAVMPKNSGFTDRPTGRLMPRSQAQNQLHGGLMGGAFGGRSIF